MEASIHPADNLWPSVSRGGIEEAAQAAHMVSLRQLANSGQAWKLAVEMHRLAASNVLDRRDMAIAARTEIAKVDQAIAAVEGHNQEHRNRAARARFLRAAPYLAV